jgi:hypothetical protein
MAGTADAATTVGAAMSADEATLVDEAMPEGAALQVVELQFAAAGRFVVVVDSMVARLAAEVAASTEVGDSTVEAAADMVAADTGKFVRGLIQEESSRTTAGSQALPAVSFSRRHYHLYLEPAFLLECAVRGAVLVVVKYQHRFSGD